MEADRESGVEEFTEVAILVEGGIAGQYDQVRCDGCRGAGHEGVSAWLR